jgi:hypothetical protein
MSASERRSASPLRYSPALSVAAAVQRSPTAAMRAAAAAVTAGSSASRATCDPPMSGLLAPVASLGSSSSSSSSNNSSGISSSVLQQQQREQVGTFSWLQVLANILYICIAACTSVVKLYHKRLLSIAISGAKYFVQVQANAMRQCLHCKQYVVVAQQFLVPNARGL